MKKPRNDTALPTITPDDVADYLIRRSSPEHKVSEKEITGAMDIIRYDGEDEVNTSSMYSGAIDPASRKKVKEILDEYAVEAGSKDKNDIYKKLLMGFNIMCTKAPQKCKYDERVYYAEPLFTESQKNILCDSIAVYPYIEADETEKIIDTLNRITTEYYEYHYDPSVVLARKYRGSCYKNLTEITKALAEFKTDEDRGKKDAKFKDGSMTIAKYKRSIRKEPLKIRFKYCLYDENKNLAVRPSRFIVDKDDPDVREANPARLMWVNGYYYLVTYYYDKNKEANFVNYRVDRMQDVKCTSTKADKLPEEFSEQDYRYKNPVMYYEKDPKKRSAVTIKCSKKLINNVIDTFGLEVKIEKKDKDNVLVYIYDTAHTGIKMWVMEYSDDCEVLEPQSLRDDIKATAERIQAKY
ncbi:MAG: WYL domain-containing protein [Oscillospiraceae bacterium]|nr:WYL domain-containing protein [Oscillospiraceae bacterium]